LPLNISREMLQNNMQVVQIRKAVTGRVIAEIESLATKDTAAFAKIWEEFGSVIKEGIYQDLERRDQLLALARFTTTVAGEPRSLRQYVTDLKANQTEIYYLVGDSIERVQSNPTLEAARARGIEVLLLTDQVDAFWTAAPLSFDGRPLKSLSRGEVDFSKIPLIENDGSANDSQSSAEDDATVIAAVKAALGERVSEVRASQRLTDSAACLVAGGFGPDRQLERLLARHNRSAGVKPILEINMRHALVRAVSAAKAGGHGVDVDDLSRLLLDQAQILDGEVPDDPAEFAKRLNRLVVRAVASSPT
jgi:molecular chaperone HtpG